MTQSHIDPAHPDTYWIRDAEQIECLASATRMTLLDRLAAEGPMSPDDLAHAAALKPTAVYHHVKKLLRAGLVEVCGLRRQPGARKPQTLYRTPAPRMRLIRAFGDVGNSARLSNAAAAILRQSERDFADAFAMSNARAVGDDRNHGFFRLTARPDKEKLARINAHLDAIAELLWSANDAKAEPIALAWAMAPLPDTHSKGESS